MPGEVILKITAGPLAGKQFRFEEREVLLVGRGSDCQIKLPDDDLTVSGYQFLLDVNPPDASLRDLDSRNGTFVNGVRHGGRPANKESASGRRRLHPDVRLKDGDEIRIGSTVVSLTIVVSKFCCDCGSELRGDSVKESARPDGTYICSNCSEEDRPSKEAATEVHVPRCSKCGRDVLGELGDHRQGDYVCHACRSNLPELIGQLLERAKRGQRDLIAIRGYSIEKDQDGKEVELGRGGMGAVYLARDETSDEHKQVALKVMLPKVAADKKAIARFNREVSITKALKHSHIAELCDWGCSMGTFFFTLEFCERGSVADLMQRRDGVLSVDEAMPIIFHVLDGLHYAHNVELMAKLRDGTEWKVRGAVHRDLSPQNILLRGNGDRLTAKIADWGLAKAFDIAGLSDMTTTIEGFAAGRTWFMPRQQAINFRFSKPEVDVWAVAACLYNMLTGKSPRDFSKKNDERQDPWRVITETDADSIFKWKHKWKQPIPEKLGKVIDRALRDKPKIEFKSAAELKRELESAV